MGMGVVMKQLRMLLCAVMTLLSTAVYSQGAMTEEKEITDLIKRLALLTDMADGCGEQMNYYGKKALTGELCSKFRKSFYDQWPSREALQDLVTAYTNRLDSGQLKCDSCRVVLQRAEELRITLVYYLDYMDYLEEM